LLLSVEIPEMKYLLVAIGLITGSTLLAQIARPPLWAAYTSVGTYSKNFVDAFSWNSNQAALAALKKPAAAVYAENRFLLKELNQYAGAVILPTGFGGLGLGLQHFGGTVFRHSQLGLGFGKRLGEKIDVGVQFNYNVISLAGYGSSNTLNFELGSIWHISSKMHTGFHVYNPVGGKFGKRKEEKLATVYQAGLGYEFSDHLFISSSFSKTEGMPVNIMLAMQYSFASQFFSRAGIGSNTGNYFWGMGVQWSLARLDIVGSYHPQLGWTPACMLLFNFNQNQDNTGE
jgi:hypothetical protein